jgi:hypothetical protein
LAVTFERSDAPAGGSCTNGRAGVFVYGRVPLASVVLAVCLLQGDPPPVLVLSDTNQERDGLAVATAHPDPGPFTRVLTHGYSGRLVRLYRLAQRFAHPDRDPQPAVLVLSDNQGGFPRFGLHLDTPRLDLAYVDLHRGKRLSGAFAAIDQIYPHELLHIIVHDLAGSPPDGNSNQIHAIGVKTDRGTAFSEGFAEHAQIMAVDAADALPETRALASDEGARARAFQQFASYRKAMVARFRIAPRSRMTFPLWFSGAEQVLRYHAVRENLYARTPDVPAAVYTRRRAYTAYLLENTLPGEPDGPARRLPEMLSTEGVVSALFHRFVTDGAIQRAYQPAAFYARFGVEASAMDGLDNAYLKLFAAIREGGYDAGRVLDAYVRLFPEERSAVDAVVGQVFLGQALPAPPELWLRNEALTWGTSLFDQSRALPRTAVFDLNAASRGDLIGVPGIELALAEAIVGAAPFASIDDLERVPGMTGETVQRFRTMQDAMRRPTSAAAEEAGLSLRAVLLPYVWHALAVWLGCAIAGAILYRTVRRARWWRLAVNGLAAAALVLAVGWMLDPPAMAVVPLLVLLGLPAAVVKYWRSRSVRQAALVVGAWLLAALPAFVALTPL